MTDDLMRPASIAATVPQLCTVEWLAPARLISAHLCRLDGHDGHDVHLCSCGASHA